MGLGRSNHDLTFVVILLTICTISNAVDTIDTSQAITENETLVSSDGTFELGLFSPGSSKNRYVGIWYRKIPSFTVVWVANRDHPITNTSEAPVLKFIHPGILALMTNTSDIQWSTNSSRRVTQNPVAQLLDSGNLVLREADDADPENYLWQSFDYPTDTLLAGMKFGKNLQTGKENYISSWKSSDDPGTGDYTYHLDPTGYPQTILRKGAAELFRTGPWNGVGYSGMPGLKKNSIYSFEIVINSNEVYYDYWLLNKSVISRFVMNASGNAQRWTWVDRTQGWVLYLNAPIDNCDSYKQCGPYGSCNVGNSPICGCLPKFVPRFPEEWAAADWSNGCTRRTSLDCKTDGFKKLTDIKLPDTNYSRFNVSMSLKKCREVCLKDCSCMAYTNLDIRKDGSGCLLWFGELLDIKVVYGSGQDIYIKVASSELDSGRKKNIKLIAGLTTLIGMIFIGMGLIAYICKRKQIYLKLRNGGVHKDVRDLPSFHLATLSRATNNFSLNNKLGEGGFGPDLPSFHLATLSRATNNFSLNNKLGEGGFGPVYKGALEDGREIAVKRLSKTSMQGGDEFKNEVIFIAKLQHRNLVKLLGFCIQGHESMLVYEYMPNKSLDLILFDETKSKVLDWPKRFKIINGIARGLMYLHQDSRLRIIHRDLKASNILLDSDMNPKIADFGMARTFGGNESEGNTSRVVGTFGYMSPEYAIDGLFSVKSDVFSFGVIMLEILSGKRNRGFSHKNHDHNLAGHAWLLYKEKRSLEVVDMNRVESCYWSTVERLIHVGLLCVQKYPEDRPSMSSVVIMLENEEVVLPKVKEPGYFTERDVFGSISTHTTSTNEITITVLEAR